MFQWNNPPNGRQSDLASRFFLRLIPAVPHTSKFKTTNRMEGEQMATTSHEQPELLTKRQAAELLQCSTRQIELLTQRGRIARPVYLGERSPRWRRADLLASLVGKK